MREATHLRHYSERTEQAYVAWVRRFIVFHGKRHPGELGEREVRAFLSSLAAAGSSATTQNQALSAILFLYGVVLGQRLGRSANLAIIWLECVTPSCWLPRQQLAVWLS